MRAWKVPVKCSVTTPVGPQVGILMSGTPTTHANACGPRAGQLQGAHVSTHGSVEPAFLRPLVTITDDSLASYGIDEHGIDLLGHAVNPM